MKDRTVLITGGTGCLGTLLSEKCIRAGARVLFTYNNNKKGAARLESLGAFGIQIDLSQHAAAKRLADAIKAKEDQIHILVNNAALTRDSILPAMKKSDWDQVWRVDYEAPVEIMHQLSRIMPDDQNAKIINIISRTGIRGARGQANYTAAKGALIDATRTAAQILGQRGILVNAVNPGFMLSEMTAGMSDAAIEAKIKESFLNKVADAEETADFIMYLLSAAVKTITGQIFHCDSRG